MYVHQPPQRKGQKWHPARPYRRLPEALQGAQVTADTQAEQQELIEEYPPELLTAIPNGTIFAYNLGQGGTAGGMKVRWKIRVATGPEAQRAEARQADAIREALVWLRKHPQARPAR
jgi:hypothetical protein